MIIMNVTKILDPFTTLEIYRRTRSLEERDSGVYSKAQVTCQWSGQWGANVMVYGAEDGGEEMAAEDPKLLLDPTHSSYPMHSSDPMPSLDPMHSSDQRLPLFSGSRYMYM
jgi:hypothetical protein